LAKRSTTLRLTDALTGARAGLTRSPTGALLLWCGGQLAAPTVSPITVSLHRNCWTTALDVG